MHIGKLYQNEVRSDDALARTYARTRNQQALRALFPEWQTLWGDTSCSSCSSTASCSPTAPLPGPVREAAQTHAAQEVHDNEEEQEGGGQEREEEGPHDNTGEGNRIDEDSDEWEHV